MPLPALASPGFNMPFPLPHQVIMPLPALAYPVDYASVLASSGDYASALAFNR